MNEYIILVRYHDDTYYWTVCSNEKSANEIANDFKQDKKVDHVSYYLAGMRSLLDGSDISYLASQYNAKDIFNKSEKEMILDSLHILDGGLSVNDDERLKIEKLMKKVKLL